jgi:hypothetical protein
MPRTQTLIFLVSISVTDALFMFPGWELADRLFQGQFGNDGNANLAPNTPIKNFFFGAINCLSLKRQTLKAVAFRGRLIFELGHRQIAAAIIRQSSVNFL